MARNTEDLKKSLDQNVSSNSPQMLHHQGIKALANDDSDSMGDLDNDEIEAFSILRSLNNKIELPMCMSFIDNQISLSRARDRRGRLEYAACYKAYPAYVVPGGGGSFGEESPGLVGRIKGVFSRGNNNELPQQS